ncbi:hypothetical protein ACLB2K_006854 [Fragaria x ananassa]
MPPRRTPRQNPLRGEDEDVQGDWTNAMEQFFQRFSTSMVPEINYDRAYKNGARAFSHAVEPLDAQNWVETIEKMFIQVRCLEDRKVGLATQFFEKEAWHWWLDLSRGMGDAANHMSWDQFTTPFRERYISHAHVNRMREEFRNLKKSDDMTVMVSGPTPNFTPKPEMSPVGTTFKENLLKNSANLPRKWTTLTWKN